MTVVERIILFVLAIFYISSAILVLRDIFLISISAIKCRKVKGCMKDDCPFRSGCTHIAYSPKERERMQKAIDRLE